MMRTSIRAVHATGRLAVLIILLALLGVAGGPRRTVAQPRTTAPQAPLEEATRLEKAAQALYEQGKFQEAIPLAEQVLAIREKALGGAHPAVADSLNDLATFYWAQGLYARAEPLFGRALAIREKVLGPNHPDVAASLHNLALLYATQGLYARAEPLFGRALTIREKVLGPTHVDIVPTLTSLALTYKHQGMYARAEPLYVRSLAIAEQAFGPTHREVATVLINLAALHRTRGAYARAEPLLSRALAIQEQVLGAAHPAVADSLINLAALHHEQGAYARAEPLLHRSLALLEKALGTTHPKVASTLNQLALLYRTQGAYARAEPLYARALAIRERVFGPTHPEVSTSLFNLAIIYQDQREHARAEPLLLRALDIREKALGATHPEVAYVLGGLAGLYKAQGAYARAEPLLSRALAIRESALGPTHPYVAISLTSLALLYLAQGAYVRAEPLLTRALAIREHALEPAHPDIATSLGHLAQLYQAQGAYARAESLYAHAAEIREVSLKIELERLSESRRWALMALLRGDIDQLVSFHAHSVPASAQTLDLALTTVLRRKGRILDSLVDHGAALRAHLTSQLRGKLAELSDARAELSAGLRRPPDGRATQVQAQTRAQAELRSRIDDLEAELVAASAEYRIRAEPVTVAKVQAALPRGAALVELVQYRRFDPRQGTPWQEVRYLAYLLPWRGAPQWIPLGEAASIDVGVDAVLAMMRKDADAAATRVALRRLDELLLAPIRDRLAGQGVLHVILSPDGKLNLVPFEVLIDPQGHYAIEQWLVSYVTSGRDLLRLGSRLAPRSTATIVADPDYGPGPPFGRLAGTRAEVQAIAGYLSNPRALTGEHATKLALAGLEGPAVLHIATHGFYARGTAAPAPVPPPGSERGMFIEATALPAPPPTVDPSDALDRAGIALAGANSRPDGIASARELASYDWWGTQLVVLSACESGVGAVPSGEGVYGLRRALVLAGTQAQVVSLWNVSDVGAGALMREFYGALARGVGRAQALRAAKLAMLHQPQYAHPYYWAAFIAAGDWRPLDKATMRSVTIAP